MRENLRLIAYAAFLPILAFLFYYPYNALAWRYNVVRKTEGTWYFETSSIQWVDVELGQRITFFLVWTIPVICGVLALIYALRILVKLIHSEIFTLQMAQFVFWMGVFGLLSSFTHLIAAAFSPMILSWNAPDGTAALRFWYSSTHIASGLYGLGFVMMGYVMKEASQIADENDGFL